MIKKFLIFLIKSYQLSFSQALGLKCRFIPSCSDYAIGVIKKYTLKKSVILIVKRILKCHPFHPGGYDPVV